MNTDSTALIGSGVILDSALIVAIISGILYGIGRMFAVSEMRQLNLDAIPSFGFNQPGEAMWAGARALYHICALWGPKRRRRTLINFIGVMVLSVILVALFYEYLWDVLKAAPSVAHILTVGLGLIVAAWGFRIRMYRVACHHAKQRREDAPTVSIERTDDGEKLEGKLIGRGENYYVLWLQSAHGPGTYKIVHDDELRVVTVTPRK